MKQLKLSEIHKVALDILIDVTDFCEKNQIDYFISCGTLLGAIRHKGFIPWDHDIDINMPRDSYERFLSGYRTEKNYRIVSAFTDKHINNTYAKIFSYDTARLSEDGTVLNYGVNIDIFPLDSFVSEKQESRIFHRIKPVKEAMLALKNIEKASKPLTVFLHLLKDTSLLNFLIRSADKKMSVNHGQKGDYLSVLGAPTHKTPEVFKREELFPTRKEGIFEGHTFRIPNNADRYLTLLYGDYMKLPPLEKIKSMGIYVVYWKE